MTAARPTRRIRRGWQRRTSSLVRFALDARHRRATALTLLEIKKMQQCRSHPMAQEGPAINNRRWLNPKSSGFVTILCILATPIGAMVNIRMADWKLGENVSGLMVWLSMGLMALGFFPGIKNWRLGRIATRVSSVVIVCYIVHVLWVVAIYKQA